MDVRTAPCAPLLPHRLTNAQHTNKFQDSAGRYTVNVVIFGIKDSRASAKLLLL